MNTEIKDARLPVDPAARKRMPLVRGLLDYFPDALAAVAEVSMIGNDQHNPGQELHWERSKSTDHPDCLVRHLIDRGTLDSDGSRHSAKVAWRALAMLQTEIEAGRRAASPPVILCDVDEVVCALCVPWLARYNARFDDNLTPDDLLEWDFGRFTKPECGIDGLRAIHDEPGIYAGAPDIPGAFDGVSALREAGYRVVFVTSSSAATAGQKLLWLRDRCYLDGTHQQTDVVTAYDKSLVRGDLLIDDGLHNVEGFDGPTILFDRPWNRSADHPARARDWPEVVELVKKILPLA